MSEQTQKKNMRDIFRLIFMDLGYIYGERESGPNGAKKVFLTKSAAFLRALGKDLGFTEMKVNTNPGGIAVSGDVSLYGMWDEGNGVYFQISQPIQPWSAFLYRNISGMTDYTGDSNRWMPCGLFEDEDYRKVVGTLLALNKKPEVKTNAAA